MAFVKGTSLEDDYSSGDKFKNADIEELKQVNLLQSQLIIKYQDQIKELENKANRLENLKTELTHKLTIETKNFKDTNAVMKNYENLLVKVVNDSELSVQKRQRVEVHASNLENAFKNLLEKYEQAKFVISGLEKNESTLQRHLELYENIFRNFEDKYSELRTYASEKLNEAKIHMDKNNKEYVAEIAKLKTKNLQSLHKIKQLEKSLSCNKLGSSSSVLKNGFIKESIFEPLVTNFK